MRYPVMRGSLSSVTISSRVHSRCSASKRPSIASPFARARTTNASPFDSSGPLAAGCRFFLPALRVSLAMAPVFFLSWISS